MFSSLRYTYKHWVFLDAEYRQRSDRLEAMGIDEDSVGWHRKFKSIHDFLAVFHDHKMCVAALDFAGHHSDTELVARGM